MADLATKKKQVSPEGIGQQPRLAKIIPIEDKFAEAKNTSSFINTLPSSQEVKQASEAEKKPSLKGKISQRIRRTKKDGWVIEIRTPSENSNLIYNQIVRFVYLDKAELKGISDIENWQLVKVVGNNIIFITGDGIVIGLVDFGKMDEFTLKGKMELLRTLREHGAPVLEPIGYAKTSDGNYFMIHDLNLDGLTTISNPELFTEEQGVTLAKKIVEALKHLRTFNTKHGAPRLSNTFVDEETLKVTLIGTPHTCKVSDEESQTKGYESEIYFALAGLLNAGVLKGIYVIPEILESYYGSKRAIPPHAIRTIQGYRKFVKDNARSGRIMPTIDGATDWHEEKAA